MRTRTLHLFLIVIVSLLVGYYIGISKIQFDLKNYKPQFSVLGKENPPSVSTVDFSRFWSVWQRLENLYYDKDALDPNKLLDGAISGMVEGLDDPYTVYLPPRQNDDFKQGLAGQFEGIGAELGIKNKQIIVVAPLDGTPAQKAGIKPEDIILKVDDESTEGWTISEAVEKIRGKKGTKVILLILHKGKDKAEKIEIVRGTIVVKSVTVWVKKVKDIEKINTNEFVKNNKGDDVIAYIRLSQFGDNTNKEWLEEINKLILELKTQSRAKGIVLDLRNNPGGYLNDATFIASEFLKSGTVVIQERRNGEQSNFSVSRRGLFTDMPLVVLINKGSASASEIVAAALRDHKRAKLVGETSFGKGTIQQAEDLGQGAGIHITIAKWLSPNGVWIHGKGMEPDIKVSLDDKDQEHDKQLAKAIEELVK